MIYWYLLLDSVCEVVVKQYFEYNHMGLNFFPVCKELHLVVFFWK